LTFRTTPFVLPFLALVFAWRIAAGNELVVEVSVEPGKADRWQAEYTLSESVTALVFARGNGDYRAATWRLPRGFVLERFGATDRIRRKNGKAFGRLKVSVDTYSERIPKDYTPYIRFSDGSVAVFSGQFAVGVPMSTNADDFIDGAGNENTRWPNAARITFEPGRFEQMIVATEVTGDARTVELGDGEYVYLGSAEVLETPHLISVMDAEAPVWLRELLYGSMAETFEYYERKLGPLADGKPFLLTSFTALDGRRINFTGGVVGSQMAIQLGLGDGIRDTPAEREFMAQFFAHESAHLWNNGQVIAAEGSEAWLHEGSAEAMAWLALAELGVHSEPTAISLFESAANECIAHLEAGSLATAGRRGEFKAYYECGAVIALATNGAAQATGSDLFTVWRELIDSSRAAEGSYRATDYYALTDAISMELTAAIQAVTEGEPADPQAAVKALLEIGNVAVIDADEESLGLPVMP
jgi:hypothetical protein